MVARGDLGVECPPEDVPLLQKQIIDECRDQGRPVIVATQMLESMIESPTPTRAEASDVATAIYDGADAIMLSAESAAGKYPEEAVAMQQRIINRVESDPHYRAYLETRVTKPDKTPTDAIITAARQIANTVNAKAIVTFSLRGSTVLRASKTRPRVPVLALCPFVRIETIFIAIITFFLHINLNLSLSRKKLAGNLLSPGVSVSIDIIQNLRLRDFLTDSLDIYRPRSA